MTGFRKSRLCLFVLGMLIGICLEIFLLERNTSNQECIDNRTEIISRRISCLILIKHNHERYVGSARQTWLKHCDDHHIVKVHRIPRRAKTAAPTEDGFGQSVTWRNESVHHVVSKSAWGGLCKALHKINRTDWLLIVPDNLIVLVDNLRYFVRNLDGEEDHYYGYAIEHYDAAYNTLSAGILLSSGSLQKLYKKFHTEHDCDNSGKYWRNEDVHLGKYLKEFGIFPKDTRDQYGRGRFHGFNLVNLLHPGKLFAQSDYRKKALYSVAEGLNCCSTNLITLDVSAPDVMVKVYYLLYKLVTVHKNLMPPIKTEGIGSEKEADLNKKTFFWKDFLRERGYNESAIENITVEEYYKIWEKILPLDVMYNQARNLLKKKENIF
ncbi:hypothetical protein RUM43_014064 [Polyplax serrata]|uniref:Uncharacterized protein n=1 Tax=Polyplax serrata TaxID=468196 RepID=A0AAN8RZQ2_POLSC